MIGNKEVQSISIEDIIPNRFQPRLAFGERELNELSASIKQHGIISPLLLRRVGEKFEIIAGERRYKAATMAGLNNVPAIILETDDNTSAEIAIIENIQRKDLTAIEEAQSYKKLLDKGNTQEMIAKKLGIAQSTIANKLRLLALPEEVQEALLNNKISERHARSLLRLNSVEKQIELLNKIVNEKLTVRETEEEIDKQLNSNIQIEELKTSIPVIEEEEIFEIDDNEPTNQKEEEIDILKPFSEQEDFEQKLINPIEEFDEIEVQEKPIIIEENKQDFLGAINKTRDFTNKLEKEGFKVSTEEFDFEDMYQIVIKIKKDE